MPSAALTVFLLGLPSAYAMQLGTAVSTDATAGWVSVAPGLESRPTMSLSISPNAVLSVDSRVVRASLRYQLRLFRRFELSDVSAIPEDPMSPPVAEIPRFLAMHSGGADVTLTLNRGWNIAGTLQFQLGEVDVPSAYSVLGQNSGSASGTNSGGTTTGGAGTGSAATGTGTTQPSAFGSFVTDDGVIETISLIGGVSLSGKLDKIHDLQLSLQGNYNGPLSRPEVLVEDPTMTNNFNDIEQGGLNVIASVNRSFTRRDQVSLTGGMGWTFSPQSGNFRSLNATASYTRQFGRTSSFTVGAGLLAIQVLSEPQMQNIFLLPEDSMAPVLNLGGGTQLLRLQGFVLGVNLNSSVTSQTNFVTGTIEPRLNSTLSFNIQIAGKLGINPSVLLGTLATFSERTVDPAAQMNQTLDQLELTETILDVQVPIDYDFGGGLTVGGGFSYSTYGPRFADPDFAFQFPSYSAFLRVQLGLSQKL